MFEKIVKIMEKSKEENKDIMVAYAMVKDEYPEENFENAFGFYKDNYTVISALKNADKMDLVKELCEAKNVEEYIKQLKENGVI